jgi:hypothetical protein
MTRRTIHVHPSTAAVDPAVLCALAALAPVEFTSCADPGCLREGDVVLIVSGNPSVLDELPRLRLRGLLLSGTSSGAPSESPGEAITFANCPNIDPLLRGRVIGHRRVKELRPVKPQRDDKVLARYGDQPVWVVRPDGLQIVSTALPLLSAGVQPFDYLNGYHFIQLLPVLHFLRQVTADIGWSRSPLRACFMFDDPNLHWSSYGFVRYEQVAEKARTENFHVAFATVPLDMWCSHSRTVELFQAHRNHLSLIIHGNDHTHSELGQARSADESLGLIAQSLSRVAKFEQATNLHVDRVIVPPHEAFVDAIVPAMMSLGVEGVSLAPWSLRYWNRARPWPPSFGLEMAEMMDGGFPVLPRFEISENCEGPVTIAAFLGSPILLSGHHSDVAGGLEVLSAAARVINSLGDVQWRPVESLLRSNYLLRRDGSMLSITPFSSRFELLPPDGVTSVVITSGGPWLNDRIRGVVAAGETLDVSPSETIRFTSVHSGTANYRQIDTPGVSGMAASRRILCELRDRLSVVRRAPVSRIDQ